jgi:hypothetical protein
MDRSKAKQSEKKETRNEDVNVRGREEERKRKQEEKSEIRKTKINDRVNGVAPLTNKNQSVVNGKDWTCKRDGERKGNLGHGREIEQNEWQDEKKAERICA